MASRGRTLVVDDDPLVLEMAAAALGGAAVTAACVGEARRLLGGEPFDRVISDLNLTDGDGISVLSAARELQPHARRWLATGHPDERAAEAVRTGLAERLLRKPWRLAAFRA